MSSTSVRIDSGLFKRAKIMAKAHRRTASKQLEHWAQIGILMEENPDLTYEFVRDILIAKTEKEAGELEAYTFG